MATTITVPARFNGPAHSGNGGWTSGRAAELVEAPAPAPVRVVLRKPPPLDRELAVTRADAGVTVLDGDDPVLSADPHPEAPIVVEGVDADVARAAEARYAGHTFHPFPTCFACGTGREPGAGLRIFPGRVDDDSAGRVRVAATWTPHPSTAGTRDGVPSVPVTWAALDCIGGWAGDLTERLMVLGTMTAVVEQMPTVGAEHVLVGLDLGTEGRRTRTASTLYSPDGRAIARAEHVWIAVPRDFGAQL